MCYIKSEIEVQLPNTSYSFINTACVATAVGHACFGVAATDVGRSSYVTSALRALVDSGIGFAVSVLTQHHIKI